MVCNEQTSSSTFVWVQRVSIRESQLNSWSRPKNPGIKILKILLRSLGSFEYIESRLNRWIPASYKGHPVTCITVIFKASHDLKICISVGPCLCFCSNRVFCCPTPNMWETRPGSDGDTQLTLTSQSHFIILHIFNFSICCIFCMFGKLYTLTIISLRPCTLLIWSLESQWTFLFHSLCILHKMHILTNKCIHKRHDMLWFALLCEKSELVDTLVDSGDCFYHVCNRLKHKDCWHGRRCGFSILKLKAMLVIILSISFHWYFWQSSYVYRDTDKATLHTTKCESCFSSWGGRKLVCTKPFSKKNSISQLQCLLFFHH